MSCLSTKQQLLSEVATMKDVTWRTVSAKGYTDSVGAADYNVRLSRPPGRGPVQAFLVGKGPGSEDDRGVGRGCGGAGRRQRECGRPSSKPPHRGDVRGRSGPGGSRSASSRDVGAAQSVPDTDLTMDSRKTSREADIVVRTDANLKSHAHDAGRRAHDRALEKRGSVMKTQGGLLVVERRNGTVEVLREMPPAQSAQVGTILKRR